MNTKARITKFMRYAFAPTGFTQRANRRGQNGAALLIALVFSAIIGTTLATIAVYDGYNAREKEALVTGYEAYEIAQAARLYVRDRFKDTSNAVVPPQVVPLSELRNNGYLPADMQRANGGVDYSALNQAIHIIMTNWPINGDPNDPETVPTAFVFFNNANGRATSMLSNSSVKVLRDLNANIIAPSFDYLGNLTSTNCKAGGRAVSRWDTGCLSQAEFTTLMAALPASQRPASFIAGSLILPSWKVGQPDQRAVMRFAQPENPHHSTMLTDLKMGTPIDNCANPATQLQINTTDSSGNRVVVPSGLCDMRGDGALNDRFNIKGISNLAAQRMIVAPQGMDVVDDDETAEPSYEFALSVLGDIKLDGDLRAYSDIPLPDNLQNSTRPASHRLTHRLDIPDGTLVAERNVYVLSTNPAHSAEAHIGEISRARRLVASSMQTPMFHSLNPSLHTPGNAGLPVINVTTSTTLSNNLNVTNDERDAGELIAENLRAHAGSGRLGATLNTSDTNPVGNVQVSGVINTQGGATNITVNDPARLVNGNYIAVIGQLTQGQELQVTDPTGLRGVSDNSTISVNSTRAFNNGAMAHISVTGPANASRCRSSDLIANGCPNRQFVPAGINP